MLKEKNVVITGANKGIGKAILLLFAQNKANIIACTRKSDKIFLKEIEKISSENNVKISNINFDLREVKQVKDSANEIIKNVDKIDVLINNAGAIDTSLFQMTKIEFR